jgi:Leucine-rich repeat (LRR) protein
MLLTQLTCGSNPLTALDVSTNTALTCLMCYSNQLTALDVSTNTVLTFLYCYDNQLTSLDVSKNTALTSLGCSSNSLTALDVSKNMALIYLQCYNNQLTALDASKKTALTTLYCNDNQLTALDVSKNTALRHLQCYNNAIPLSDLYAASQQVDIFGNRRLGIQTLPTVNTRTNVAVVVDNVFNGAGTVFTVRKDSATAVSGTDYNLSGGNITFLMAGTYSVEIKNPGITSQAKVIATYNVTASADISVYVNVNRLYVSSPENEQITIYSLSGNMIYQSQKAAGKTSFDISSLSKGVLIVRGSSGWEKKVVKN